jgi:ABC-2 type transport system permease protein
VRSVSIGGSAGGWLLAAVVRAEWVKLRSLRSTYWALAATVVLGVGLGTLLMVAYSRVAEVHQQYRPAPYSLGGFFVAQLAVAVFGVLALTSEYATGSIRATFAAVPQRRVVLAGKAVVVAAATAVVGAGSSLAAFLAGQAVVADPSWRASLSDADSVRAVLGTGGYLVAISLLGLAVGTIVRRTVGAIAVVVGLVFLVSGFVNVLPESWSAPVGKYLPSSTGQAIIGASRFSAGPLLPPWVGLAVLCGYVAVALLAATLVITRHDT